MDDEAILTLLSTILGELLGDDSISLDMDTTRNDVPGWDSFAYINFIVAVEMRSGLKFKVSDVEAFQNIGEIVTEIQSLSNA